MSTVGLYLAAILIWGSTWIAITYQLGSVPPEVSVAYRFALASLILFVYCGWRQLNLRFSCRAHLWMAAQGALLFGLNYICVYFAEGRLNSGLVAVVFSLMIFLNMLGSRIFFGTPFKPVILLGAALGVGGIALVFQSSFRLLAGDGFPLYGMLFALAAVLSASLGNMVAAHNQKCGLPVVQMNAYGMLYGGILVGVYAWGNGSQFVFDGSPGYVSSLLYLTVFGSVLAFGAYLTLMRRIGADRAAYITVAIPIVALLLSTLFEGLRWQAEMFVGVALCLAGNVLVLRPGKFLQRK